MNKVYCHPVGAGLASRYALKRVTSLAHCQSAKSRDHARAPHQSPHSTRCARSGVATQGNGQSTAPNPANEGAVMASTVSCAPFPDQDKAVISNPDIPS
jgi:hypothetical protein